MRTCVTILPVMLVVCATAVAAPLPRAPGGGAQGGGGRTFALDRAIDLAQRTAQRLAPQLKALDERGELRSTDLVRGRWDQAYLRPKGQVSAVRVDLLRTRTGRYFYFKEAAGGAAEAFGRLESLDTTRYEPKLIGTTDYALHLEPGLASRVRVRKAAGPYHLMDKLWPLANESTSALLNESIKARQIVDLYRARKVSKEDLRSGQAHAALGLGEHATGERTRLTLLEKPDGRFVFVSSDPRIRADRLERLDTSRHDATYALEDGRVVTIAAGKVRVTRPKANLVTVYRAMQSALMEEFLLTSSDPLRLSAAISDAVVAGKIDGAKLGTARVRIANVQGSPQAIWLLQVGSQALWFLPERSGARPLLLQPLREHPAALRGALADITLLSDNEPALERTPSGDVALRPTPVM